MKGNVIATYESVAVSTRIRLARNFADYPFPSRLLTDAHGEEQAEEIVRIISTELGTVDSFTLYRLKNLSREKINFLRERNLISKDLERHRKISAVLLTKDESISVMINEEDHVRAQYFMRGFDLKKAYERVSGIDDCVSECIPFAFDEKLGYLTACPTNLGTGLRASVMLFLPAVISRGLMPKLLPMLARNGLTVRGAFGEGSGTEAWLYQISNEMTLGYSEGEILELVERAVATVVEMELIERERMKAEGGLALQDRVCRAFGTLSSCQMIGAEEFLQRTADVKLGVALGILQSPLGGERCMLKLDSLITSMRPANTLQLQQDAFSCEKQDAFRAQTAREALMELSLCF